MRRIAYLLASLWLGLSAGLPVAAQVRYDVGRRQIKGVQLLQDYGDSTAFYYVPQFPRLATKADGTFEFLILKYVGATDTASGGLFHALIEFSLPPSVVADLEKELRQEVPKARIIGPVQLLQAQQTGEDATGAFQIVSATLSDTRSGGFTRSMVTSGKAPLMPGSKAVVAALLRPQGATLLWNSLTGPTSDVSVAIHAYYEAIVEGYNAKVTADMSTVYEHFSNVSNVQKDYTRRQIRDVVDQLRRDGSLHVDVLDRTEGLTVKAKDMEGILQLVTDKLTELMFDPKTGWSTDPASEPAVEANQIQGRQEEGFFAKLFGAGDTKYYTDNQYVLKNRKDIRQNVFTLLLSKKSTLKVPVDAAGNLAGLYTGLHADERYFRIVNLADPAFEFRPVHFQVDGDFLDSFRELINFVAVNVRKVYGNNPAFTQSFQIGGSEVKDGRTLREVAFPRLGLTAADWGSYEYQVRWSLRGGVTMAVPSRDTAWIRTVDAAVSLTPPFERRVIEIDADRQLFKEHGIATAVIQFATVLAGSARRDRQVTLRASDAEPTTHVVIYHDPGQPIAYRVAWFGPDAHSQEGTRLLESDYLYVTPPAADTASGAGGSEP